MVLAAQVARAMVDYFQGDVRRINHLMKVYGFAKCIGELEGLDAPTQLILELAALTHDIGIKVSEQKYHSAAGAYQQLEGPNEARTLLNAMQVPIDATERVCWLIARHHTYSHIQGLDYQILVEADFLVNIQEDSMATSAVETVLRQIFTTETGRALLQSLYLRKP